MHKRPAFRVCTDSKYICKNIWHAQAEKLCILHQVPSVNRLPRPINLFY